MSIKLLVRNLGASMNNLRLEQLFARHGRVKSVRIIRDEGYVQMRSDEEARKAMAALHGCLIDGGALGVSEVMPDIDEEPALPRPRYGNGRSGGSGVRSSGRS